jgi:hypothetical protein
VQSSAAIAARSRSPSEAQPGKRLGPMLACLISAGSAFPVQALQAGSGDFQPSPRRLSDLHSPNRGVPFWTIPCKEV